MPKLKDLRGMRFGRLEVKNKPPLKINNRIVWSCKCDCGKTVNIIAGNLGRHANSCGCLNKELASSRAFKHGACKTTKQKGYHQLSYCIWQAIKERCYSSKCKNYKNYGRRGIKMYSPWKKNYTLFLEYIIQLPKAPSEKLLSRLKGKRLKLSLDRVDNDGNYEPGNLKWSTPKEQANNRRKKEKENITETKANSHVKDVLKMTKDKSKPISYVRDVKVRG